MTDLNKTKLKQVLTQAGLPDAGVTMPIFNLVVCQVLWAAAQAEQREDDAAIAEYLWTKNADGIQIASMIRSGRYEDCSYGVHG